MVKTKYQTSDVVPQHEEADAERKARHQREVAVIRRAEADIDAGLGIDDGGLEEWLDALDLDENAPLPASPQVQNGDAKSRP